MTAPFIMLVDDEVPFVETMAKRLGKETLKPLWLSARKNAWKN